jgi:hypothetical protein
MSLFHDSLRAFSAGAAVCCVVYAATAMPAETRASIDDFMFKPESSLRIPAKADSDSDRLRTAIPIDRGQRSGERGQQFPSTA